jgi:hypothetical protein
MSIELGPVIALFVFLIGQLVAAVWWASKMSTTLGFLVAQIEVLSKSHAAYVTIETHSKDVGHIEKNLEAIWKRLDSPHACPNHKAG